MEDYIFPYWDGLEYWDNQKKQNNKTVDDDDLGSSVED